MFTRQNTVVLFLCNWVDKSRHVTSENSSKSYFRVNGKEYPFGFVFGLLRSNRHDLSFTKTNWTVSVLFKAKNLHSAQQIPFT